MQVLFLSMSDAFENLGVGSSNIKSCCVKACEDFGAPIDYSAFCHGMTAAGISSSHGPELFVWREVEIEARMIVASGFRYTDPSPYKYAQV